MLKKKNISCLCFKTWIELWKTSYSFHDSKWSKMALSICKKLSALLRGTTPKHHSDFYCFNCFHSFATEKKESQKRVCENKDFCNVIMPSEDTKILELNQYQRSDRAPSVICRSWAWNRKDWCM